MLSLLSIRDVVLIEALDLEIEPGFTALTGETGAGKSILLDALGLALGERADRSLVRNGAQRAQATAVFEIEPAHRAHVVLQECDLPPAEEGRIVLRRSIGLDGKSRAFVNDAPASVNALRKLGACLLEIHGQHASIGLMDPTTHRDLLDVFAKASVLKATVGQAWRTLEDAKAQLEDALSRARRASTDRDYLAHVLDELQKLAPQAGEEAALDVERRALMGSEKAASALKDAADALSDGKAEQRMATASRALSRVGKPDGEGANTLSQAVDQAAGALERALNELSEAQGWMARAGDALDGDPGRLDRIEERLFSLRSAARKHGVTVDQLPETLQRAEANMAAIDHADEAIQIAKAALSEAQSAYDKAALSLSQIRHQAGLALEGAIAVELPPLKLEKARFRTKVDTDLTRSTKDGIDKVTFEIAANPGAGFGELSEIASGGELSRLSLALKLVLSSEGGTLAMVFDEVDHGIGGATADAVGRRLARLAQTAQILCVTHSPQVAARAKSHWRIEKRVVDGITRTHVTPLSDGAREEELARMLSGALITEQARAAARALVATPAD
ncbi:DNA repair protein RecN [Candidatus Phycosocius spiralis]|uniref:DNA repair protein RecN n=1 Tax=Candidatus Phycosocius spiralis TaxID=2815099 RepID=A0ABQ4PX13_9PROT|nr:DNA repair protein RecN [Candidatus Phycosocius spiralis]GIU67553.1 DNA repair protein RecN [Candidatus Phycosocius spiralis]